MTFFAIQESTALGIAATVSVLIGIVLSVAGYISNRRTSAEKATEEAVEKLKAAREEAQKCSEELHNLRMASQRGKDE